MVWKSQMLFEKKVVTMVSTVFGEMHKDQVQYCIYRETTNNDLFSYLFN